MPFRISPEESERSAIERAKVLRRRRPPLPPPAPTATPPPPRDRPPPPATPTPRPEEPRTAELRELDEAQRRRAEEEAFGREMKGRFVERTREKKEEQETLTRQTEMAAATNDRFSQFIAETIPAMTSHAYMKGWDVSRGAPAALLEDTAPYYIDANGILRFTSPKTSILEEMGITEENPPAVSVLNALRAQALAGRLDPLSFFLQTEAQLGFYNLLPEQTDEMGYPAPDPKSFKAELRADELQWGVWKDEWLWGGGGRQVGWLGPLEDHPAAGAVLLGASLIPQVRVLGMAGKAARAIGAGDILGHALEGKPPSETSTAKAIGALRGWERAHIADPVIGLAERLNVPVVDVPEPVKGFFAEVMLPSNLAIGTRLYMMTPGVALATGGILTKLAGPVAGRLGGQALRFGVEGTIIAPMDVTMNAWSQGRDPTPRELLVSAGIGAVAGATIGTGFQLTGAAIPFVAKALGAGLLRLPGGRYLMRIRGKQYRTAPQIARDLVLRYNEVPLSQAKLLPGMLHKLPAQSEAITGLGPDTNLFVHVAPDENIRSVADNGLRPSTPKPDQLTEFHEGIYSFDLRDLDLGWKAYGGLVRRITEGAEPNGIIIAQRPGTKLLSMQSDEYTTILRNNRNEAGAVNWQGVGRDTQAAGYVGLTNTAGAGKNVFRTAVFRDDSAFDIVGRIVPDLQRGGQSAAQVMGRKVITPTNIEQMSIHELAAELQTGAGGWLPPSTFNATVDFLRRAAGGDVSPRFILKGGRASRYMTDYEGLLNDPRIVRLIDEIPDAIDRDQFLWYLKEDYAPGPIPKGVSKLKWVQGILTHSPGVRRATQWLEIFTGRMYEEGNISTMRKGFLLTASLRKVFPQENLTNPAKPVEGIIYIGPKRTNLQAEVTGTIADILENPGLYKGVTPEMRLLSDVYSRVLDADARLMQKYGVNQEMINRVYLPHRPADANNSQLRAVASALFQRTGRPIGRRHYRTLGEFHEVLRKHGLSAELDPVGLFIGRLMRGNQARAQAAYANQVIKQYGRVLARGERVRFGERYMPEELTGGKRAALPSEIADEVAEAGISQRITPDAQTLEKVVDSFRGILLSADLSFFGIQGFALFSTDPARYLRNFGEVSAAMTSREGFLLWTAAHSRELSVAARSGLKFYSSAIEIPTSGSPPVLGLLQQGRWADARKAFFDNPVEHFPVISQLNEVTFGRGLPIMKLYNWRAAYDVLKSIRDESALTRASKIPIVGKPLAPVAKMFKEIPLIDKALRKLGGVEGKSDFELMTAAADVANNLGGGIDQFAVGARTSLLEKTLLLTPGWIRANVGRLTTPFKVGDARGVLARRALMQQLAIVSLVSSLASLPSGRAPEFDPRETDWLDIQTPEGSIAWMPGKTYIRTLARLGGGVPWRGEKPWELTLEQLEARMNVARLFGEGRAGQIPRLATDLWTGQDFLGRRLEGVEGRALYAAQSIAPIVVGELIEGWQEGARGWELANRIWPEALGLNAIPIRSSVRRDTLVADAASWRGSPFTGIDTETGEEIFLTEYGQLSRAQKDEFDRWDAGPQGAHINEQMDKEMEERASPFVVPDEIRLRELDDIATLGEQLKANWMMPGAATLYRDGYAELRATSRAQSEFFWQQQGTEMPEPKTQRQKIYQGYYEEVVDRAFDPLDISGRLDTATFEPLENAYFQFVKDEYGATALGELKADLNIHPTDDPVAQQWRRDREVLEAGVWLLEDALFTSEYLEKHGGFTPEQAAYVTRSFNSWEEFTRNWASDLMSSLVGRPMPPEIGELTSKVDLNDGKGRTDHTWYEIFQVKPNTPLNAQTAREVATDAATKVFGEFDTFRSEVRTSYLEEHPQEICILGLWEYRDTFNARLSPYLQLCPTNPLPK